ncbi:hypothetical protein V1507DRAFT_497810 [Lipomyces tetrasporus]
MQMADDPQFEKTELHTITRQQIYNVWISITRKESAQLLMGEQDGYRLIEGLQEIGGLLGFTTPCFSDSAKYNREKMTEVFIDSTFGTNKHGYELYCEVGKRGSRFTEWFVALRNAGLHPDVVYTDKDFAEATAASIAFRSAYNHHQCLWHSLRAIDQHIGSKAKAKGFDSIDTAKSPI